MIGDLFKLQVLTATPKGELVKMEWKEIDLKRRIWEQPGDKTKNGKVHVVPLSAPGCGQGAPHPLLIDADLGFPVQKSESFLGIC